MISRVPRHPMVLALLAILDGNLAPFAWPDPGPAPIDVAQAQAALLKAGGHVSDAAALLVKGLDHTPPGNGGWLIPIDPLLSVQQDKTSWAQALMTLRTRAGTWVAAG